MCNVSLNSECTTSITQQAKHSVQHPRRWETSTLTLLELQILYIYEGESNENLKSVINIQNTAQLSCKLATVILIVWRVADRWQYDGGMQHDGAAIV